MAVTEDDRIRSTPRASKDPRSYEYARQMVYVLKTMWQRVTFDLKDWEKELAEARKNAIWERLGYSSLDEVLEKEVGYSKEALSRKIAAARDEPLANVGRPTTEERENNVDTVNNKTQGGNSTDYTLRRLARDCPEMLDRIESGELSVNAAAIEAGIRKKPNEAEKCLKAFRKAENRLAVLQAIFAELEPHERIAAVDFLTEPSPCN